MSMFENKTKSELEAGNFIAYADEPNTVVSGSSGDGGGDIVIIEGIQSDANIEMQASYNDLNEHFNNGKVCFLHLAIAQSGDNMLMHINGIYISDAPSGAIFTANVIWTAVLDTSNIVAFKADSATENLVLTMGG